VTLHNAGQVLLLNGGGEVKGILDGMPSAGRPLGIAVDACGDIWISDPRSNSISIIEPGSRRMRSLSELSGIDVVLSRPGGMYRDAADRMLIADMGNHRILSVTASGKIETVFDRAGKALGEFRHPVSMCGGQTRDTFWIVDRLNHRVQEIDAEGVPVRSVGQPGLGLRCLDLPEHAAVLPDGSLVVSQGACLSYLTLFSADGRNTERYPLDFVPKGLLVHDKKLLVCEWLGQHIYVYEIC
jgi:hypothetical protein